MVQCSKTPSRGRQFKLVVGELDDAVGLPEDKPLKKGLTLTLFIGYYNQFLLLLQRLSYHSAKKVQ